MRTRTIQITDYFTRLLGKTKKPLASVGASRLLSLLAAVHRRGDDLPAEAVASELTAAYRLGLLREVKAETGIGWFVAVHRLRDVADDALPQATEQMAAVIALAAELLSAPSYELQLDGDQQIERNIDVFSTMYNAELARLLGATDDASLRTVRQVHDSDDAQTTTIAHKAQELELQHGLRRSFRIVKTGDHKEKPMKKQLPVAKKSTPIALGVWRTATDGRDYHLEWTVDSDGGKPVRVICALERGSEAQRAVVETFVLFANQLLTSAGPEVMAQSCKNVHSSFFGDDEPFVDFVAQFAEHFLSHEARQALHLDSTEAEQQIDLLSAAEAVACERCGSTVEQFGDYAICLQCGDAQFVR